MIDKKRFEELKKDAIKTLESFDGDDHIPEGLSDDEKKTYMSILSYYEGMLEVYYYMRIEKKKLVVEMSRIINDIEKIDESANIIKQILKGNFTEEDIIEQEKALEALSNSMDDVDPNVNSYSHTFDNTVRTMLKN